jgi:hypothetical protein
VYADGRVIWDRDKGRTGFFEQRLTAEGVDLLRSKLIASGLFDRSLTLDVPEGHGCLSLAGGSAEVRRDGRLVRLLWNCPYGPCESTTATPEQVSALLRLDALFTDPVSLPSSAWADRQIRAYVPSHFAVCISTSPPTDVSRLLSLLPAPAEELLRDRSWTRFEWDMLGALEGGRTKVFGRSVEYCSKLATKEAREVNEALSGLDRDRRTGDSYLVAEGVNNWEITSIHFEPYFPHGGRRSAGLHAAPQGQPPFARDKLARIVDGVRFSLNVPRTAWENGPHERVGRTKSRPLFRTHSLLISRSTRGGQAAEAVIFWAGYNGRDGTTPCAEVLTSAADRPRADLAAALASAPGTKLAGGPWHATVGGRPATRVVLRVQEDRGCGPGFFFTWPHDPQRFNWGAFWPGVEAGDSIRLWIVDVGGKRLFFEAVTKPGHGVEQEIGDIIRSIRFG